MKPMLRVLIVVLMSALLYACMTVLIDHWSAGAIALGLSAPAIIWALKTR
jgi:peptidase E